MNPIYLLYRGAREEFDALPLLIIVLILIVIIATALVYIYWPAPLTKQGRCCNTERKNCNPSVGLYTYVYKDDDHVADNFFCEKCRASLRRQGFELIHFKRK